MQEPDASAPRPLTALSPLDGRYADKLAALPDLFSEFGLIRFRVRVETEWLAALCAHEGLPECRALTPAEQSLLDNIANTFGMADAAEVKAIERQINHDVKAVEYVIKQRLRATSLHDLTEFVHFGCTSEDINNLAHALQLREARAILRAGQNSLTVELAQQARAMAAIPMLARTHGQSASPTTMGKELAIFAHRLAKAGRRIDAVDIMGKMNGAVGNYNAHLAACPAVDWDQLANTFVEQRLGLAHNRFTTQIESHDYMAELFDAMAHWNTVLLDLDRDLWTYISMGYFGQRIVAGEVGSSTMPHKVNPIDFENSEGNIGVANALLRHLSDKLPVSRLQRDLSDSTALRNMGVAYGHCLLAVESTRRGLSRIAVNRERLAADLADAWEVLAEPVQMVMRKHGLENPYEQLKAFTRGKRITRETLQAFIDSLRLPDQDRRRLRELTPEQYIGMAERLTQAAVESAMAILA